MSYDSILKFMLDQYAEALLSWLLQSSITENVQPLKTELNLEPIRADGVFFFQIGNRIIHLEFQTTPKSSPPLPLRMLDYWVRLYRLYGLPIEQVVIFLQQTTSPKVFQESFQVGDTQHRYRVIRMWECDPQPLLEQPELLPLAVLAKTEHPPLLLSTVATKINSIEDKRRQSNIAACVELLAGINFTEDIIAMYLQEDILEASVVYQKIIKQGKKNEALAFVNRLLKKRFGEVQQTVQAQVEELSVEQLENLGEDLLDFRSINDLLTWLSRV